MNTVCAGDASGNGWVARCSIATLDTSRSSCTVNPDGTIASRATIGDGFLGARSSTSGVSTWRDRDPRASPHGQHRGRAAGARPVGARRTRPPGCLLRERTVSRATPQRRARGSDHGTLDPRQRRGRARRLGHPRQLPGPTIFGACSWIVYASPGQVTSGFVGTNIPSGLSFHSQA